MPRLLSVLIACLALLAAGCGDSSQGKASSGSDAGTAEPTPDLSPAGCEDVPKPSPKDVGRLAKPKQRLDRSKTYVATVSTTCGDFEIALDARRAPVTGGSFKYLADRKFFDGLSFHRIVPEFVIQGGDPAGDGSGGPGYTVVEAPPRDLEYTDGIVAMAKTEDEPAGASGSQFFVVTGAGAAQLTPDYALVGKVTKGMEVATKIGAVQAEPDTGRPVAPVVIESIRVTDD